MTKWFGIAAVTASLAVACGGKSSTGSTTQAGAGGGGGDDKAAAGDPNAAYGPLEVGADWQSYTKVNTAPVFCSTHGKRCCDTYVNDVGLEAYKDPEAKIPVGSVIVKVSWENPSQDAAGCDSPSDVRGPLFVMKKTEDAVDSDGEYTAEDGWWYAIHWENVPAEWQKRVGGDQIYWRTPSKKAQYCIDCHKENYDRALGMVPEGKRAW